MVLPERVLIDTSAFYALRSATDLFHNRASVAYERLLDREQELWTTSYTLVETVALLHRRLGFEVVSEFRIGATAPMSRCSGSMPGCMSRRGIDSWRSADGD